MDISGLSVSQLQNLQQEIDSTILVRKEKEKEALKQQIKDLLKQHGTTLEELFGSKGNKRAKAAPKYRNPDDPSQTWSGRGRTPNWLLEKVNSGVSKESFLIK